jgi:hypothetical protein
MSAAVRNEIANAAKTVTGINSTPYFRQSVRPFDASVRLAVSNRSTNGFGFMDTWQVWIALPQDLATADKWLDDNKDALTNALGEAMIVVSVTPSELVTDGGTIPGVIIEGARESA